jgi:hypothetical protein
MSQPFVQDVPEHVGKDADRAYRERIEWSCRADQRFLLHSGMWKRKLA